MPDVKVAPRYRGIEGLACPRCAKHGEWRHLSLMLDRKVDHREPEGFVYVVRSIKEKSPKRVFRDDVEVTDWVKEGGVERSVKLWEHHYGLVCTRCNAAYNREQATYHVFEDSELPLDYWSDHEANLELMRKRGITAEVLAAHERVLAALGIRKPQGGDGE